MTCCRSEPKCAVANIPKRDHVLVVRVMPLCVIHVGMSYFIIQVGWWFFRLFALFALQTVRIVVCSPPFHCARCLMFRYRKCSSPLTGLTKHTGNFSYFCIYFDIVESMDLVLLLLRNDIHI